MRQLTRKDLPYNKKDIAILGDPKQYPMIEDAEHVFRFQANPIIQQQWNDGKLNLNEIVIQYQTHKITKEQTKQIFRDIGMSLEGFLDACNAFCQ